ncbi:helix-turn-helix domain-containing protein [Enterococcus sp. 22-H-5-01]|uniref:helix-turn-helix domain-containing protein n=1 Tax=Enterococcus sp. 22-H-5-01 TaxID=3418555 RepID=UPI003D071D0B
MFYDRVKKIAEKKGVSIRKIETDLKFSNGAISKWNDSEPSFSKMVKVAEYLEIPLDDLLKKE